MPKQLELRHVSVPREGGVIKQADLQRSLRAARLIRDAERRARDIVRQGEQDAADFRRQGYLQGYGEGVLSGAESMVQALEDYRRLSLQQSVALQSELKQQLLAIFSSPDLALSLADDWMSQQGQGSGPEVELHIPRAWQLAEHTLRQRFSMQPEARIYLHDGVHFVIRRGDMLYEFSPDEAAGTLQASVLQRIRLDGLPTDCAGVAEAALAGVWQKYAALAPESAEEGGAV